MQASSDPLAAVVAGAYAGTDTGTSEGRARDGAGSNLAGSNGAGSTGAAQSATVGAPAAGTPAGASTIDSAGGSGNGPGNAGLSNVAAGLAPGVAVSTRPGDAAPATSPESATVPTPLTATNTTTATAFAPAVIMDAAPDPRTVGAPPVSDQIAAQISRQLQGARTLSDGTHHAVLRLSPEHLGDVTITLDVRGGGVRLDLVAGPQAITALQADLGRLRDDLAGSGLNLGDVSLHSQEPGGQSFGRDRGENGPPTGSSGSGPAGAGSGSPTSRPEPQVAAGRRLDGGLDLLV
jgi:flagellar hook-length control protein FliK